MAKKVKVIRRKKFSLSRTIQTLFVLSVMLFIFSAIFLRSYNVSLSVQTQKAQKKIVEIRKENQTLASDIQELSAYTRVAAIAQADGMTLIQNNIVTVKSGE